MKNRNIEFGVFILSIGIILLLANIGVISWSVFDALLEFWPIIFIVIGINIIFRNNSIVRIITWLLFLAILISYGYFYGGRKYVPMDGWANNNKIEMKTGLEKGNFKLGIGGTRLTIGSTNSNLVDYSVSDPDIKNNVKYNEKSVSVDFERRNNFFIAGSKRDECSFNLNENVDWDIDLDTGAINGTLDLSKLMVGNVDMDAGAADLNLIFGSRSKSTDVDINSGASSINVTVPASSGVRIKYGGGLNSTNMKNLGWNKHGDYYESLNYSSAENKINMDVDMGVGNFTVNIQK